MKKFFSFLYSLIFLILVISCIFLMGCQKKANGDLTIVFMNDTHSHLFPWRNPVNNREYGGAARWATIVNEIRQEAGEILFLHSGDMLSGMGTPYRTIEPDWERLPAYGYHGLLDIPVFGKMGLDAFAIGNHELDYGVYWNYLRFRDAPFDVLSSNLSLQDDASAYIDFSHYHSHRVYRKGNIRVAVIGLITAGYIQTSLARVNDVIETTSSLIETVKKESDVVIVLSHLGYDIDQILASAVSGIDIIVGGHSHTLLGEAAIVNETIIIQARSWGEFVGRLDLEYENGLMKNYSYNLIPADFSVKEDPEMKAWLEDHLYPITLEYALFPDGQGLNSLGAYITDAINREFSCDAAIVKIADYVTGLPAGHVSAEDFFTCLWPLPRRIRPEKDLSPEHIMDIVFGRVSENRRAPLSSSRLTTLIKAEFPAAALNNIEVFIRGGEGGGNAFFLNRFNEGSPGETARLIIDLPSFIDLYSEGLLNDSYKYENLEKEIIDVLLLKL